MRETLLISAINTRLKLSAGGRKLLLSRPGTPYLAGFCLAYVLAAGFGQWLAIAPGTAITLWPPSGLFIATLIANRNVSWPWWMLAGCFAELICNVIWFHNALPLAVTLAAGNSLEAVAGAWMVGRFCRPPIRFETLREVLALTVLAAVIAPVVSATIGSAALAGFGIQPFAQAWPDWWIGDATGVLVFAPVVLVALQNWQEMPRLSAARLAEAGLLGAVLVGVGYLSLNSYLPFAYIVMPPLLWAAVRFEFGGAVIALALLALMTGLFTVSGLSQFSPGTGLNGHGHIMMQLFLAISAFSALVVAALSRQYHQTLETLRIANSVLEARVAERTEKLRASEQKTQLLMREVNHRSKNTLGLVQAIANQTAAGEPKDFVARFSQRIRSLAANQDLLVNNTWDAVNVRELVKSQFDPFTDVIGARINLAGPSLRLTPEAAQSVSLALHELVTNAIKYGALSRDAGSIDLTWKVVGNRFLMSWTERGGPPVPPPLRQGFGTKVLTALVNMSVDGEATLDYPAAGLTWELKCPAANALMPETNITSQHPALPPAAA